MFKYVGDNESTTCFGVFFTKDTPTKVEDPHAVAKLGNNSEFEKLDGRTREGREPEPETETVE